MCLVAVSTFNYRRSALRLPEPLSPADRQFFDGTFVGNPALGGLPLLLLQDRFPFLREAILHVWEAPGDRQRVGVLHAMMSYYSVLVNACRESDRRYKQRARSRAGGSAVPRDQRLPADIHGRTHVDSVLQEVFRDAALHIARTQKAISDPIPDDLQTEQLQLEGNYLTLRLFHEATGIDVRVSTSKESFLRILQTLWMDTPPVSVW